MNKRQLYVVVDWPESQIIPQFLPKYYEQCIPLAGNSYMYAVPVEIWNNYINDPDSVISIDNEE